MQEIVCFDGGFADRIARSLGGLLELDFYVAAQKVKGDLPGLSSNLNLVEDFFYMGIFSKIDGGVEAYAIILMDIASADEMVSRLTNEHISVLDEYKSSAVQEFANIIIGAFSSEAEKRAQRRVDYTIPTIAVDHPNALVDAICAYLSEMETASTLEIEISCRIPPILVKMILCFR
ncbi:MAG: chemotaxis protein CheX [Candidatus Verstraetearchaeota archaeon]|nr:chemotaxis protein CheX [Candidatus Verstraetearchaeota archaeon]